MRLSQLEYFIKIAQCGSITKAAQELFLSQPSLTKSISNLEAEYNLQLLERTAKGVRVTPQGQEFLEYAKAAVDACKRLEHTFGQQKQQTIQRLRLASQQFDFLYPTLEQLYAMHCAAPIHIDLEEADRGAILERVENRESDIGLLVLAQSDRKNFEQDVQKRALEVHTLDTSPVYVSMGKKSPLYQQAHINTAQAACQPHVVLDTEKSMRRDFYLHQQNQYVTCSQLIFCNTIGACIHFMKETEALLYTPKWVLGLMPADDIYTTVLEQTNGQPLAEINRLVWIHREGEPLPPLAQQFMQLLSAGLPL